MIGKIIKIALKNVWKQKRRSTFNALTFAANMFALVALMGLLVGQYESMYNRNIDLVTGHFKIYKKGYTEEKRRMPLDLSIVDPGQVIKDISGAPYFTAASARIVKDAVLSNSRKKTNVVLYGIDFEQELKITTSLKKIDGTAPLPGSSSLVMGKRLAGLLKESKGDPVMLYGMTKLKSNNLVDAEISGIYTAGFDFMEKTVAYVDYDFAAKFLDMDGEATEIIVRLKDKKYVPAAKKYISGVLNEKHPGLVVRDWKEEAPELIAAAEQDYVTYVIIFGILIFLAVFIIMNTLTITVFERTAEIGTLRAIGFEKNQIRLIFFTEGMVLSFIGVVLGGLLVLPVVYFMNVHGVNVGSEALADINMPMEAVVKSANAWTDWIISAMICMVTGAVGAFIPSNKAAETNIVAALKRGAR